MSQLMEPLHGLLKKDSRFNWTLEHQRAFEEVKEQLAVPRSLFRPDFSQLFYLQVDASLSGLGAVLFQRGPEGERRVISYASSSLTSSEKKYHINELETLGALFGLKKYRAYLQDRKFVLVTDSSFLFWLEKNRDSKAKLTRWSLLLQEYDFEVQTCKGRENELADYLSRHPLPERLNDIVEEERLLPPQTATLNPITANRLYEEVQQTQNDSQRIRTQIAKWNAADDPDHPAHRRIRQHFLVRQGNLFKIESDGRRLLVVPPSRIRQVIEHYHNNDRAAHPGIDETTTQIRRLYHYPRLRAKVRSFVRQCLTCATVKGRQQQDRAPLKPHRATTPFQILSVDFAGPYKASRVGNRYVLVVEDIFTKWVEAKPLPNCQAERVIEFLQEEIFPRYGSPQQIISDNGGPLISKRFQQFCRAHQIRNVYSSIYKQRENPVERRIQELKKTMKTLLLHVQNRIDWDLTIPKSLAIIRRRVNRAIGRTPAEALLGYLPTEPGDWRIPEIRRRRLAAPQLYHERVEEILENDDLFRAQNYEANPEAPLLFQPGDMVMVRNYSKDPLATPWTGPHPVVLRLSPEVYEVDTNGRQFATHIDDFRPAPTQQDLDVTSDTSDSDPDDDNPMSDDEHSNEESLPEDNPDDEGPVRNSQGREDNAVPRSIQIARSGDNLLSVEVPRTTNAARSRDHSTTTKMTEDLSETRKGARITRKSRDPSRSRGAGTTPLSHNIDDIRPAPVPEASSSEEPDSASEGGTSDDDPDDDPPQAEAARGGEVSNSGDSEVPHPPGGVRSGESDLRRWPSKATGQRGRKPSATEVPYLRAGTRSCNPVGRPPSEVAVQARSPSTHPRMGVESNSANVGGTSSATINQTASNSQHLDVPCSRTSVRSGESSTSQFQAGPSDRRGSVSEVKEVPRPRTGVRSSSSSSDENREAERIVVQAMVHRPNTPKKWKRRSRLIIRNQR